MPRAFRDLPDTVGRRPRLWAAGGGLLLGASFPPRGWWPLGLVGLGVLVVVIAGQDLKGRARVGFTGGLAFYLGALLLIWRPSVPVLVVVAELFAASVLSLFVVLTAVFTPPGRWALLGFPGAVVLVDALQARWPFGGLPLVGVALSQVDGPIARVATIGGQVGVVTIAALAGAAIGAIWLAPRRWIAAALAVVVVGVVTGAFVAPDGTPVRTLDTVLVQGGGQRGVDATPYAVTYALHRQALHSVHGPADLVVLPEGTAHVSDQGHPFEYDEMARAAERLHTTLVVGIVEQLTKPDKFLNSAFVWAPDGRLVGRYDKVHGVPFAEYVPGRKVIGKVVDLSLVPTDLQEGHDLEPVASPAGRLGIIVSFEVFFSRLSRSLARQGAQIVLVPTNAGSFTDAEVPTFEVAASRLRALETGRWVLQVTPTGYTAIVDPEGRVVARSRLGSDAQLIRGSVELRSGRTPYVEVGDTPALALAGLALSGAWALERRRRTRDVEEAADTEPTPESEH